MSTSTVRQAMAGKAWTESPKLVVRSRSTAQVLDVHVAHQELAFRGESLRLAEDRAVLGDERVPAEDDVLRGFARAAGRVDVGADAAGGLLRHERPPVVRLADQLVRRRQVEDDVGAVQDLEGARGQRAPEVLADLDADHQLRRAPGAEQQVGADRHVAIPEAHLAGEQVPRRREPPLLVVLLVAGDVRLRHEAVHDPARHDRGGVEEGALGRQREADDEQRSKVGGSGGKRAAARPRRGRASSCWWKSSPDVYPVRHSSGNTTTWARCSWARSANSRICWRLPSTSATFSGGTAAATRTKPKSARLAGIGRAPAHPGAMIRADCHSAVCSVHTA